MGESLKRSGLSVMSRRSKKENMFLLRGPGFSPLLPLEVLEVLPPQDKPELICQGRGGGAA